MQWSRTSREELGLTDTDVSCLPGTRVKNVHKELQQVDVSILEGVIITTGTNDCASNTKLKDGKKYFETLVKDLKVRAPDLDIVLSTVCPRLVANAQWTTEMNTQIRSAAKKYTCKVVDNKQNFRSHEYINPRDKLSLNTRYLLMNISTLCKRKIVHKGRHQELSARPVKVLAIRYLADIKEDATTTGPLTWTWWKYKAMKPPWWEEPREEELLLWKIYQLFQLCWGRAQVSYGTMQITGQEDRAVNCVSHVIMLNRFSLLIDEVHNIGFDANSGTYVHIIMKISITMLKLPILFVRVFVRNDAIEEVKSKGLISRILVNPCLFTKYRQISRVWCHTPWGRKTNLSFSVRSVWIL